MYSESRFQQKTLTGFIASVIPSGVQNNLETTSGIWDFIIYTACKLAAWVFWHHLGFTPELISILKFSFPFKLL